MLDPGTRQGACMLDREGSVLVWVLRGSGAIPPGTAMQKLTRVLEGFTNTP